MIIKINGKECEAAAGTTIHDIVEANAIDPFSVAVALNGAVLSRDSYGTARVAEADDIRLIRAVAGG